MYLVGYQATGLDTGKQYIGLATSSGHYFSANGPRTSPVSTKRLQHVGTAAKAVAKMTAKMESQCGAAGEYGQPITALVMDVPDGADPETILTAWDRFRSESTVPGDLASVVAQFESALMSMQSNTTSGRRSARPPVAERAARLTATSEEFYRPNGEQYMARDLGGMADVHALRLFRSQPQPIHTLLRGPAGSGKTALAEAAHGAELVTMNCDGDFTVARMVGQLAPTPDGGWKTVPGPLTLAMENGWALLADEVNRLPSECMSVLYAATDGRGVIRFDDRPDAPLVVAQPGFCLIGTLNPDQMGGNGLPEALTSRFSVAVEVTTDFVAARSLGAPGRLVTVAENLHTRNQRTPDAQPVWVPQMRELLAAKRLIAAGFTELWAAQSLLSQCPHPEDVPLVAEALARVYGQPVDQLGLGAQL